MYKYSVLLGAAALTVAASGVQADERWYFAPSLSYIGADDDRQADNGPGVQLGVGKPVSDSWNVELGVVADSLDLTSGGSEYDQVGLLLDGLYFFNRGASTPVYAVVGLGALKTDVSGNADTNAMANVGVGLFHAINSSIGLRADVRYRLDEDDRVPAVNRFGDWLLSVGLTIPFGKGSEPAPVPAVEPAPQPEPEPEPAPVPVLAPVPADGDNDGVIDGQDNCPATPVDRVVDGAGCELDSDGDGVVDGDDRCPDTATGVAVGAAGCPLDSDNDGIVDASDSCPDTQAGVEVDGKGCELAEVIILKGVTFKTGSAYLAPGSLAILNEVAETLKRYPAMRVDVAGYTDNRGAVDLNTRLSQARAESVKAYLVSKGVNGDNLEAKGYGPVDPIASNDSAEGRAQNRRVEMHIVK